MTGFIIAENRHKQVIYLFPPNAFKHYRRKYRPGMQTGSAEVYTVYTLEEYWVLYCTSFL